MSGRELFVRDFAVKGWKLHIFRGTGARTEPALCDATITRSVYIRRIRRAAVCEKCVAIANGKEGRL
jgi:hypothetical protein